jgi:protein-tyrosine phosphatase
VDISAQRARQLSVRDFEAFDWILCADRANVRDVLRIAPATHRGRVGLLLEWAGIEAAGEVPDPYTGGPEDFEQVWQLVDSAAQAVVARLAAD